MVALGYARELEAVLRWFDDCDAIAMQSFRIGVRASIKEDGTPVTKADQAIEQTLRAAIERDFPGDAVLGEEEGPSGSSARRWILDPIDGTKNYVRGIPIFATLVALEVDGRLVVGGVSAPALATRWWSRKGGGAFRNGSAIRVSRARDLSQADVASGGIGSIRNAGFLDGFLMLVQRAKRNRGFGDFWGHMLVAQGSLEVMVEPVVNAWDLAAPKAIVEEAGGRMTTLAGEDRIDAGNCVTTNGHLHAEVLAILTTPQHKKPARV